MKASDVIVRITSELLQEVTGKEEHQLHEVRALDLHLRGPNRGKIKRMESLLLVPNLAQLNLSYNLISKIEGLDRLVNLTELNLAENSISRIEGIDHLKSLERLNLSGNLIQRIPESISSLISLVHFRIARNKLDTLTDVRYLSKLAALKHLRLDENPILSDENAPLYVIYYVKSLSSFNGQDITNRDRSDARRMFATDEIADLKSRLSSEQHTLASLKRDLQQSPDRAAILRLDVSRGQIEADEEDVDRMNRNLADKLQVIQATEEKIMALKKKIQELEAYHGSAEEESAERATSASKRSGTGARRDAAIAQHLDVKSPGDFHMNRLRSSATTPHIGSHDYAAQNTNIPDLREVANQQVTEMTSRIEKMTARLLQAEGEKKELERQLASQKSVVQGALQLQHDLRDCEDRLGLALEAAQSANMQLVQREAEVERCNAKLKEKDRLLKVKEDRLASLETELGEMTKELDFFRSNERKKGAAGEGVSREGERRAQVDKLEAFSLKMTVDELESKITHLNEELEESMKHAAKLSEQSIASQKETEKWKEKVKQLEKEHKQRVHDLEDENAKYRTLLHDIRGDLESVGKERDKYEMSLRKAESDLNALMRAKQKFHSSKNTTFTARKKKGSNYLDLSTDSELEQSDKSDDNIVYTKPSLRDESMTQLERKAVEIMAQVLLEELKQSQITHSQTALTKADSLKEACIRAMLRIFSSKEERFGEEKGDEGALNRSRGVIGPFEVLGDRRFLSQLVAEIYDNMSTLEDSGQIKAEVKQLEVVVAELEKKAARLEETISTKENVLKVLEKQGQDAKRLAEGTLDELDQMSRRLQSQRNELLQLNAQQQLTQREVEVNKLSLQEISSMYILEQNNLQKIREKVVDAKQEYASVEHQITAQKDALRKEEHRFKNMKFIAQEEIQTLHQEVKNIQADILMKKQSIDEMEAVRK
eukprot:gene31691-38300_t